MKNRTKLSKRIVAFFVFMILTFNSFAAVVSDNDGSAFVTKAEFDTLRGNFQNQIDDYNISIDSKIDGAIASYLAGIKLSKRTDVDLPLAGWKKVTAMSQALNPRFEYPEANVIIDFMLGNNGGGYNRSMWTYARYFRPQTNAAGNFKFTSTRPTISGSTLTESNAATSTTKAVWDGVKCNWKEALLASKDIWTTSDIYAIEVGGTTKQFNAFYLTSFYGYGYQSTMEVDNYWKAGFSWYTTYNSHGWSDLNSIAREKFGQISLTTQCEVASDTDETSAGTNVINDPHRPFKHIMFWRNTTMEVYNDTFLHTLRNSSVDTLNSNNWIACDASSGSAWTISKNAWCNKTDTYGGSSMYLGNVTMIDGNKTYNNATNTTYTKIPRVGLAKTNWAAQYLLQFEDDLKMNVDGNAYTCAPVNLYNGFPLVAGKKGDTFTWEPKFKPIRCSATSTPSTYNVAMSFSMSPYNERNTLPAGKDFIKLDYVNASGKMTNQTVAITSNDASYNPNCKVSFVLPDDGWVYVKWWPDIASSYIDSYSWEIDLDLENCDTIEKIIE